MNNWLIEVMISLFVLLFAATGQANTAARISPANKAILAKIIKTTDAGQQLFVSYDKGKNWERITWFGGKGQVVNILWSSAGRLAIGVLNTSLQIKIVDNDFADALGVFNPATKVIYWVDGCYADPKKDMETLSKIKWLGANVISYDDFHLPMSEHALYHKSLKLTPEFLARAKQDSTPQISHFASELMISMTWKNGWEPFAAQITPKTRGRFLKFCKMWHNTMATYFAVSISPADPNTNYTVGTDFYLEFGPNADKIDRMAKKGVRIGLNYCMYLSYDHETRLYEFHGEDENT